MSLKNYPSFFPNFSESDMHGENSHFYEFKSFRLSLAERQLLNDVTAVPLTPKAFNVLAVLVERAGHLVEKEELMQLVWPDSFVEEANVARIVHTLRRVLDEDENGNKFIETVAKKGYRFVAKVEEGHRNGANLPPLEAVFDPIEKQEDSRRNVARSVLVGIIAMIVALAAVFWFFNRSWPTKTGVNGVTSRTSNGEAYQHYQQGRLLLERKLKGDVKNALANFEKAIELDPNFADAYAAKADAKFWMFWPSDKPDDIVQARNSMNKAMELDEANSYAYTISCRMKATYDWEFKGAEKECQRAIELDPNSHEAHSEMAMLLSSVGREDEALTEIDTTISLSPTSFNKRSRGQILYYSRRYDEAIEQLLQVVETDPNFFMASKWISRCFEMKMDFNRAVEWHMRHAEMRGASPEEVAALRSTYDENGWPGVLRNMTDAVGKREENSTGVNLVEAAIICAQLGETEKAFDYLNKGYDQRELFMIQIGREPRLDPIRNDPRFDDLLERIGLKSDAPK